ncbi:DNA-3-methyladenine glycosylase family protein [Leptolyngbya iicbica]|uniref:DNA-3-methyladenine glycosylase II n=2 Tax=Cyanophyceae TaxID=3028117 RepID=A0A4Q7E0I6_9CYAN|nr:DNA-3-methyladenine glycosylase [Leptolyngbya sp. LK]RZM74724.1 DNA-3-methyladenine glycosylase 2 family protein [Leptolyngbya sp. LK]
MQPSDLARFHPDALFPPSAELRQAIAIVSDRDPDFQKIEAEVGPLLVRSWPLGFAALIRIIIGQQLSSQAAQAIFQRLVLQNELTPETLQTANEAQLKQVGLSRAKIATCQCLAAAVSAGQLNLEELRSLPDAAAIEQLTQIKGIGPWTAEVYLLFCLNRLSSFPAADLALQTGYQLLKQQTNRPTRKELLAATDALDPYRGAVAHLLWHYYRHRVRK